MLIKPESQMTSLVFRDRKIAEKRVIEWITLEYFIKIEEVQLI